MPAVTITPASAARPVAGHTLDAEVESATLNAPTDYWEIPNDGKTLIKLINEHATQSAAFSIVTPGNVDGNAIADRLYNVPAMRDAAFIGPFPVNIYGNTLRINATAQGTKRIATARYN